VICDSWLPFKIRTVSGLVDKISVPKTGGERINE